MQAGVFLRGACIKPRFPVWRTRTLNPGAPGPGELARRRGPGEKFRVGALGRANVDGLAAPRMYWRGQP
jgi:hypothetical protein